MSVRIGSLAVRLPDAHEIESPRPRLEAPEEIRLSPLAPMPVRRAETGTLALPDAPSLALLGASIARLEDLDVLSGALDASAIAVLGSKLEAIRGLALGVREVIDALHAIEQARHARAGRA